MEKCPHWINSLGFSDEAHFHLNGAINNHNDIFWGAEPPEEVSEISLKGPKSTCLCASNARWSMLGPYWFEDANVKTVIVNGERYRKVLRRFDADLAQLLSPNQLRVAWFMHDGAPLHTAVETIDFVPPGVWKSCHQPGHST